MKISEIMSKYNILISEDQEGKFEKYYDLLVETNKKFNLTAITDHESVNFKHFLDSVLPQSLIPVGASIIDVGSGAGFPAIPLKIVREDLKICMVDSLNKRVNFLNETINCLKLENITAVHDRAEDFAKTNRECFSVAVARAVAPLNTLLEYLLPLVKVGGKCLIYKAQKLEEELSDSEKALKVLGGELEDVINYRINEIEATRNILVIKKVKKTPINYPRSKNLPKTNPIK